MTQEQKRVLIAQHAGWRPCDNHECGSGCGKFMPPGETFWRKAVSELPNYFSDLNAINDVCLKMPDQPAIRMRCMITDWGLNGHPETFDPFFASAAIRAEAFGIVMGLWKEGE